MLIYKKQEVYMTAVKQQAFSMLETLSDESVVYILKILEGLQGLEQQRTAKNLQQRVSDIQQGINCAEHELIEDI